MELTEQHKDVLRHMLGIRTPGEAPWRNHFIASEGHDDMPALNELLVADYVTVRDNPGGSGYLFRATDKGRAVVTPNVQRNRPAAGLPDDGPADGRVGPLEGNNANPE